MTLSTLSPVIGRCMLQIHDHNEEYIAIHLSLTHIIPLHPNAILNFLWAHSRCLCTLNTSKSICKINEKCIFHKDVNYEVQNHKRVGILNIESDFGQCPFASAYVKDLFLLNSNVKWGSSFSIHHSSLLYSASWLWPGCFFLHTQKNLIHDPPPSWLFRYIQTFLSYLFTCCL